MAKHTPTKTKKAPPQERKGKLATRPLPFPEPEPEPPAPAAQPPAGPSTPDSLAPARASSAQGERTVEPVAAPAPAKGRARRTAGALAKAQREISISEFFAKNRHLLGFDSPAKALLTAVKEAVDNALDACEEAGILPVVKIGIEEVEPNARYRLSVEDNGPGIVKSQVPRIFGKLLYGSKFHRLRQSLPGDEPVLVERRGRVEEVAIAALVDALLGPGEEVREVLDAGIRVPAFDPDTLRYGWREVSHVIRHARANEVLEVETEDGRRVRVTGCHSLFAPDPATGRPVAVEARALRPGDLIVAPARVPFPARALEPARVPLPARALAPARVPLPARALEPAGVPAPATARLTKSVNPGGRCRHHPSRLTDFVNLRVAWVRPIRGEARFVYDLSVPGCENFLAGRGGWIACHNSRGQQGIGISAAGLYGLLTTGKPVVITSRTGRRQPAHHFELAIDTRRNEPDVIVDTIVPDWAAEHGTRVEIELQGAYKAGRRSVDEYIEQTALANPHAEFHYHPPRGRAMIHLPRVVEGLPPEPEEIKPHPHGVELGVFLRMLADARGRTISNVLARDFSRVSGRAAKEILAAGGVGARARASEIGREDAERLYGALQSAKLQSPSLRSVVPIGEALIRKGLEREAPNAELFVTRTRPPRVYRGNPFLVEVGLAYGGQLTGMLDHVGAAATEGIWIAGVALDPARRVDQGLLAVQGMTRAKIREVGHRAHVDPLKRAGALDEEELGRLRQAIEGELTADAASRPIELVRLANRVPLLYQQSACAVTQAVIDTNWKRYGLSQPRGGLPLGPVVLVVHIASVWVPFTSESKEAIAHYPEIIEEVQRGLQECGRHLGAYLNRRAFAKIQAARRDKIGLYAGELCEALHVLTGRPKDRIREAFERARRKQLKLDDEEAQTEESNRGEAKRRAGAEAEGDAGAEEG